MERKQETARVLSSTESSVGSIARKLQTWTLPWTQLEQSSVVPVWLDFQQLLQLLQIVLVEMLRLIAAVARHKPSPNESKLLWLFHYRVCCMYCLFDVDLIPGFPWIPHHCFQYLMALRWNPLRSIHKGCLRANTIVESLVASVILLNVVTYPGFLDLFGVPWTLFALCKMNVQVLGRKQNCSFLSSTHTPNPVIHAGAM